MIPWLHLDVFLVAREYGMEFAFLEMVSSEALVRKNAKTYRLMKSVEADSPLGAQIVGCDPHKMGEAAAMLEDMGFDSLDINMGCPVPKIVSPGGGSALLIDPEKARAIFQNIVKRIKRIPVTVKMRIGFKDASGREAIRIAQIAEACGLDAISIHGRTRAQGYSGKADWSVIGKIKASVNIPVFANGDINNGADTLEALKISGCDGVMVGRGALGNPWIYKQIESALNGEAAPPEPTLEDKREALLKHMEWQLKTEDARTGILKMRKISCWYFKNLPHSAEFRNRIMQLISAEEMRDLILGFGKN